MRVTSIKGRSALAGGIFAVVFAAMGAALATDIPSANIKLAAGVVRVAGGYEVPSGKYIVANGTNIFNDVHVYDTKVVGSLKRGETVDAVAKVKGNDWLLVGKNGEGIGYVPISMLAPADQYDP